MKFRTWHILGASGAVLAVAIVALALWAGGGLRRAEADGAEPVMNLLVPVGATSCDDNANPTTCDVASGGTITLKIEGTGVDASTVGGFGTLVYLDGLTYTNTGCSGAEVLFTPTTIATCAVNGTGGVGHGNTGLGAPYPSWGSAPDLVSMPDVQCKADGAYTVVLAAVLAAGDSPSGGSVFLDTDGAQVFVKATQGPVKIEDPNANVGSITVNVADILTINCGEVAGETPTATATETPAGDTPTPTVTSTPGGDTPTATETPAGDTPTPTTQPPTATATNTPGGGELGDVNCDGSVNSIDALWILWFDALITDSVPCPDVADVDEDGDVDALDALYVLWIELNLV